MNGLLAAWLGLSLLAFAANSIDWSSENKMSYCALISHRRIYRQQRLEDFCQLKVLEVDGQVFFNNN